MKIAILSPVAWRTPPRHYGPWEQIASNIAEGLMKVGLEVSLFATADSITLAKLEAVVEKGYEEDRNQDAKVQECLHISNVMEKAKHYDLIHNHFDFLPLTYSWLIKTPMLTTIHGFSSPKIIPVYKKYNATTSYVSVSDADRNPELSYLATVYHGLNASDFPLNLHPQGDLLYLGRIHPDKGTAEAIAIAKKAKRKLLIAGIIQDPNYYDEHVKPYLDEQIQFIGHAGPQKRKELLGNAQALLHPINFHEPFGLSVAEAMLCGTPVVAFQKGSMAELIQHQKTGFLVDNIEEAVAALQDIKCIDRNYCHHWSYERFSQEKMIANYVKLYQQLLYQ